MLVIRRAFIMKRIAVAFLIATGNGCVAIDWAMLDEHHIVEAMMATPPFDTPLVIEVDALSQGPCAGQLPPGWDDLIESRAAVTSERLIDRKTACALDPAPGLRRSEQSAWKRSDRDRKWRVPVGVYGIDGTNEDFVIMTRGVTRSSATAPWTLHVFSRLQKVVASQTSAGKAGLKGKARFVFASTPDGWKVSSVEMSPIVQTAQ